MYGKSKQGVRRWGRTLHNNFQSKQYAGETSGAGVKVGGAEELRSNVLECAVHRTRANDQGSDNGGKTGGSKSGFELRVFMRVNCEVYFLIFFEVSYEEFYNYLAFIRSYKINYHVLTKFLMICYLISYQIQVFGFTKFIGKIFPGSKFVYSTCLA